MTRHPVGRWLLLVVAIAAAAAACVWAARLESQLRTVRQTTATAQVYVNGLHAALAEVRRALAAMASPGQAAAGWSRRAEAAIEDARAQINGVSSLLPEGAAPAKALDVIDRLGEAQRRLRDHAVGGKPLMAADVAFGEAMPQAEDAERQVTAALEAATTLADRQVAALRDQQMAAVAGALAALLLAALLLTPLPRTTAHVETPADAAAPSFRAAVSEPVPGPASGGPVPDTVPVTAEALPPPAPLAPAVDLPRLARVCADLSAVAEAEALPAMLERAASVLDAHGLILWVATDGLSQLRVAATTGYDARLVERLGAVDVTGDNPTARAFASRRPVTAVAREGRRAVAAVPIGTMKEPRGVLAAELRASDPATLDDLTAALQIIAAQLATLVGVEEPAPATEPAPPEEPLAEGAAPI